MTGRALLPQKFYELNMSFAGGFALAGCWRVRRWGLGDELASEGFGEEGGGESIDLLAGGFVLGFDRYGHIEIWATDDGSPSESSCDQSLWISRSAVRS